MSEGIRSGVNWMRLNCSDSASASVRISSVLASPGTPTSRQCPRAKMRDQQLLDHLLLADDHPAQLLGDQPVGLVEFLTAWTSSSWSMGGWSYFFSGSFQDIGRAGLDVGHRRQRGAGDGSYQKVAHDQSSCVSGRPLSSGDLLDRDPGLLLPGDRVGQVPAVHGDERCRFSFSFRLQPLYRNGVCWMPQARPT